MVTHPHSRPHSTPCQFPSPAPVGLRPPSSLPRTPSPYQISASHDGRDVSSLRGCRRLREDLEETDGTSSGTTSPDLAPRGTGGHFHRSVEGTSGSGVILLRRRRRVMTLIPAVALRDGGLACSFLKVSGFVAVPCVVSFWLPRLGTSPEVLGC